MLTLKEDVDEKVRGLLKLSRDEYDKAIQCKVISKLYYDIQEFGIAKFYIDSFLKAKSDSVPGLVLKANIHNELKEYEFALTCYDKLYHITKNREYLSNVCYCLMKFTVEKEKIKFWINKLENEIPDCDEIFNLKLHLYQDVELLYYELSKLEMQLETVNNYRVKRQYLLFLDKVPPCNEILSKCIDFMTKYDILNDIVAVECCVKIFQRQQFPTFPLFKPLYCVLLISAVKNSDKLSSTNPWRLYLRELLTDLYYDRPGTEDLYKELKAQFLYHLVSSAHIVAISNDTMTEELTQCFYHAYSCLQNRKSCIKYDLLPEIVGTWLTQELIFQSSTINHMVHSSGGRWSKAGMTPMHIVVTRITRLLWSQNNENLTNMFDEQRRHNHTDDSLIVEVDIRCHTDKKVDLELITWQLLCHQDAFDSSQYSHMVISRSSYSFISSLLRTLFPLLEFDTTDNISKVDLVTFLLGTVITCRYHMSESRHHLPIPFEYWQTSQGIKNDSIVNWWNTVCDCLVNDDQPIIGRETLSNGINIVQARDNNLEETIMLELGRCLYEFADFCYYENITFHNRAVSFLYDAYRLHKEESLPKTIPFTLVYSTQKPPSKDRDSPFFEMPPIPIKIVEEWRYEALLCCIDVHIRCEETVYKIEDLIDCVEKIPTPDSHLCLQVSRMCLSAVTNKKRSCNRYMTLAWRFANKCWLNLDGCDSGKRQKMELLLKKQLAAISVADDLEDRQFNGIVDPVISDSDSVTKVLVSRDDNNESLSKQMKYCLKKCDIVSNSTIRNHRDIDLIKSRTSTQQVMARNLSLKFENMSRKLDQCKIIDNHFERLKSEQRVLRQQLHSLENATENLRHQTALLDDNIRLFDNELPRRSPLCSLDEVVCWELMKSQQMAETHINGFDELEMRVFSGYIMSELRQQDNSRQRSPIDVIDSKNVTNNRLLSSDSTVSIHGYENANERLSLNTDQSNDEVIIVQEPFVTEEQKTRARALMLPEHFYYYENVSGYNENESSSEESREEIVPDNRMECEESGIHSQPMVLPNNEFQMVLDGWKVGCTMACKLFSSNRNQWIELGYGCMKVLSRADNGKVFGHLIMKKLPEETVCFDKIVSNNWPKFKPIDISATSTFMCDICVDGDGSVPFQETFALRFRSMSDQVEFTNHVRALQDQMKN